MKRTLSVLAFAALAAAAPVHAGVLYSVNFTGTVYQTQGATGKSVGDTVMGHFDLDSTSGNFLDFSIAGQSAPAGFDSSASFDIGQFDAFYTAQVSPVSSGMSSNDTFSLDLSSLNTWPSSDTAYTLLTDKSQLMTNLDTVANPASAFPSTFSYYIANADGTGVVSLSADLTSLTSTATPEPSTLALLASWLLGVLVWRRRA